MVYQGKNFVPHYDQRKPINGDTQGPRPMDHSSSYRGRGASRGRGRGGYGNGYGHGSERPQGHDPRGESYGDRSHPRPYPAFGPGPPRYDSTNQREPGVSRLNGHDGRSTQNVDQPGPSGRSPPTSHTRPSSHSPGRAPHLPTTHITMAADIRDYAQYRPNTPAISHPSGSGSGSGHTSATQLSDPGANSNSNPSPHLVPLSSPANPNALDSLDKLRQFKATVEASRQAKRGTVEELEPNRLAQLAENFLNRNAQAQAQSKINVQQDIEPGELIESSVDDPPHGSEREQIERGSVESGSASPRRREFELKERLRNRIKDSSNSPVSTIAGGATPVNKNSNHSKRLREEGDVSRPDQSKRPRENNGDIGRNSQLPEKPEVGERVNRPRTNSISVTTSDEQSRMQPEHAQHDEAQGGLNFQPNEKNFVPERFRRKDVQHRDASGKAKDLPASGTHRASPPRPRPPSDKRSMTERPYVNFHERQHQEQALTKNEDSVSVVPNSQAEASRSVAVPNGPRMNRMARRPSREYPGERDYEPGREPNAPYLPPSDSIYPNGSYDSRGTYTENGYQGEGLRHSDPRQNDWAAEDRQAPFRSGDHPPPLPPPTPPGYPYVVQPVPAPAVTLAPVAEDVVATLAALKAQIARLEAQLPVIQQAAAPPTYPHTVPPSYSPLPPQSPAPASVAAEYYYPPPPVHPVGRASSPPPARRPLSLQTFPQDNLTWPPSTRLAEPYIPYDSRTGGAGALGRAPYESPRHNAPPATRGYHGYPGRGAARDSRLRRSSISSEPQGLQPYPSRGQPPPRDLVSEYGGSGGYERPGGRDRLGERHDRNYPSPRGRDTGARGIGRRRGRVWARGGYR